MSYTLVIYQAHTSGINVNQTISRKEVLKRVNQKLHEKNLELIECQHLCRSCSALGDYYMINLADNSLIETNIDLKKIARDQACLADSETLDD